MSRWVEITFDCAPLRSVCRLDVPLDASPAYRELCERVKAAIEKHGSHNTYYLHNARCVFHLANAEQLGTLEFRFEGTVMTYDDDRHTARCAVQAELVRETCGWLTEPVVRWFEETVSRVVAVEFDRYIEAGGLDQAKRRIEAIQAASDASGGFMGMYLYPGFLTTETRRTWRSQFIFLARHCEYLFSATTAERLQRAGPRQDIDSIRFQAAIV